MSRRFKRLQQAIVVGYYNPPMNYLAVIVVGLFLVIFFEVVLLKLAVHKFDYSCLLLFGQSEATIFFSGQRDFGKNDERLDRVI